MGLINLLFRKNSSILLPVWLRTAVRWIRETTYMMYDTWAEYIIRCYVCIITTAASYCQQFIICSTKYIFVVRKTWVHFLELWKKCVLPSDFPFGRIAAVTSVYKFIYGSPSSSLIPFRFWHMLACLHGSRTVIWFKAHSQPKMLHSKTLLEHLQSRGPL